MLVVGAFRTDAPGNPGGWTARGFIDTYTDWDTYSSLLSSLQYATAVEVSATILAVFFAWVVTRTTTPLRRLVTPMMVVILGIPTMFFAVGWGMLGAQPSGIINQFIQQVTGSTWAPINVNSWPGLIGVTVLKYTAVSYLLLLGPFRALDRSLEEASITAGASRTQTVLRIVVPVLAPAVSGVFILGFAVTAGVLDLPLILGLPARIHVLSSEIYRDLNDYIPPAYSVASSRALLLILLIALLVIGQRLLLRGRQFTTVTGKSFNSEPVPSGRWRLLCTAAIILYGLLALILPLAQLVIGSFQPFFGVWQRFTLRNYEDLFNDGNFADALVNTLVIGVVAGFLATVLAFCIAYASSRSTSKLRGFPEFGVWLLVAVPGVILGLSMVWAYLSVPGLRSLYSTIWIVMIALIASVTPVAARAAGGSVGQVGRELEDASRISGGSSLRSSVGIVGRLVLPSLCASWFVSGLLAAGNLDVPILLSSPTNETVPVLVYQLYSSGEVTRAAAAFCIIILIVVAFSITVLITRLGIRLIRRSMRAKR